MLPNSSRFTIDYTNMIKPVFSYLIMKSNILIKTKK